MLEAYGRIYLAKALAKKDAHLPPQGGFRRIEYIRIYDAITKTGG
jgi:hypothetical protein